VLTVIDSDWMGSGLDNFRDVDAGTVGNNADRCFVLRL
jgi:hypothetical protein